MQTTRISPRLLYEHLTIDLWPCLMGCGCNYGMRALFLIVENKGAQERIEPFQPAPLSCVEGEEPANGLFFRVQHTCRCLCISILPLADLS